MNKSSDGQPCFVLDTDWLLKLYKFLFTNYIILNRFRVRQGPLHESVFVFVKVTSFI